MDRRWQIIAQQGEFRREQKQGLYVDLNTGENRWFNMQRRGTPCTRVIRETAHGTYVLSIDD